MFLRDPTPTYNIKEVHGTAAPNSNILITLHKNNQLAEVSGSVDIGEELLLKITVPGLFLYIFIQRLFFYMFNINLLIQTSVM